MIAQAPNKDEIDELVSFLPKLYAEGLIPIVYWHGGETESDGKRILPWPEYDKSVIEFIKVAEKLCWTDCEYSPQAAKNMLEDENAVLSASFSEIKIMLTFCVRGERFCEGHWSAMIENGHIRRILQRLTEI